VILEADGKHVLTDCWTSGAVLLGLGLTILTKWAPWDPICGILVGINILVSGGSLIRSALAGLMDRADPEAHRRVVATLERESARHGVTYHALRHRSVGDGHWVEMHLLFPEGTSLTSAHRTATTIERAIAGSLLHVHVTSHLECRGDHDVLHPEEIETR
jgi:cation diffusion facilitator family transporter